MSTPPRARRRPPSSSRRRRAPRRRGGSDLLARILVAVPAIAFAIFITASGGWVFTAGVVALGLLCLHEFFRLYEGLRPVKLAGFAALIGLGIAANAGDERQVLLAAVAYLPLVFLLALAMPPREGATLTASMAITTFGVIWIGMAIAHAVLATWCAGLYQDWLSHGQALILGVAVGLAAPLGDLFESQVKRDAGAKDAGRAFGAHGGALDRLDAAFFTLVAGYYVWLALI
jgi:phosphatidate cytidylyltransferase